MGTRDHPDAEGAPYFVTFATHGRRTVFRDSSAARQFVDELHLLRHELGFLLLAYVVMPDHVHLIVVPPPGLAIGKIMQYVKGRFARLHNQRTGGEGRLWQSRYYEAIIRDEATLWRRIEYIETNPVTAGLAASSEGYPFSSAASVHEDVERYLALGVPG